MKTLFVSYARHDRALIDPLLKDLECHLGCGSAPIRLWQDNDIVCGTPWDCSIRHALQNADLGLLLVSPAFGCSSYIQSVEIPELLDRSLAVGVRPVCFKTQLNPALRALQFFRISSPKKGDLFYSQCATRQQREMFAAGLYQQILTRLANLPSLSMA